MREKSRKCWSHQSGHAGSYGGGPSLSADITRKPILRHLTFCAVCVRAQAHDNHQVVSSSEFVMSTRWNVVRLSHNTTVVHRLNPTYTCIHTIHAIGLSCDTILHIHKWCPKLPLDQSMILIKREATTVAVRPPPRQANPLRHSLAANDGDAAVRPFAVPERPLLFAVE